MGMTNFGPLSKSNPVPSFHPPTLNPQTFRIQKPSPSSQGSACTAPFPAPWPTDNQN